jgi:hypothetical protein
VYSQLRQVVDPAKNNPKHETLEFVKAGMAKIPANWDSSRTLVIAIDFGEYLHPAIDQVDSPAVYRVANSSIALRWSHSEKLFSRLAAGRTW